MIRHILAMRSTKGEVSLFDQTDNFQASYKDGKWINDAIFEFADIEENFEHIENDDEILEIIGEARAALGKPLVSKSS